LKDQEIAEDVPKAFGGEYMSQALFSAASGATYHEKRLDILANNLSNINTAGFKQDKLIFRVPKEKPTGVEDSKVTTFLYAPPPLPSGTTIDFTQGDLRYTDHPLDLALDGSGFFCIQSPDGRQYTRNGSFALNQEGVLVTKAGYPVEGEGGAITISGQDVRIDESGTVYADGAPVGAIKVVRVLDLHNLQKMGETMFAPSQGEAREVKSEDAMVKQGFIEMSNVNGLRAMTEMIDVMRGYESYQKVIQHLDDVTRRAVTDVGKL
jgi:flagellar basal-body rod protein FlgF